MDIDNPVTIEVANYIKTAYLAEQLLHILGVCIVIAAVAVTLSLWVITYRSKQDT